jgi:hypothetical protein
MYMLEQKERQRSEAIASRSKFIYRGILSAFGLQDIQVYYFTG